MPSEYKDTEATTDPNAYPWKVDDGPARVSAVTPGGETMYFEDVLDPSTLVGQGDGEGNVYPPLGVVVRRGDGLWIEATDE